MKLQSSLFHKLSLGLLSGLALASISACDEFMPPKAETPESPAAQSPAMTQVPASPSPVAPNPAAVSQSTAQTLDQSAAQPAAPSPAQPPVAQPPVAQPPAPTAGTITVVASSNPAFSTLTAALTAAGLTDALAKPGAFTVFAPTNEAFSALPPETLQALLRPANKALLTKILTYHVVPQKITAAQISSVDVPTLEGNPLKIRVDAGGVKINDAAVTQADVMASNGVIHAINKVILPPDFVPAQLK